MGIGMTSATAAPIFNARFHGMVNRRHPAAIIINR